MIGIENNDHSCINDEISNDYIIRWCVSQPLWDENCYRYVSFIISGGVWK